MKKILSLLSMILLSSLLISCSNNKNQIMIVNETENTVKVENIAEEKNTIATEDILNIDNEKELKLLDEEYSKGFDLQNKIVTLNNGEKMPVIGLGTFLLTEEQAEESTYNALKAGMRLIDTAAAYNNEEGVGRGIKRAIDEGIVTREEIFVTTKLWPEAYDDADESINERLNKLNLEYIDLLLLHQAFGNYKNAYQSMERAVDDGRVKSIGLSNFYEEKFSDVISFANIKPQVLQNEFNPTYQQKEMRNYIKEYGTRLMAWFPLGGKGGTSKMFSNSTIVKIANNHKKSPAQVVLRWHMQVGSIAIPGSTNKEHIEENYNIFDFELSEDEMNEMRALDTGNGSFNFRDNSFEERFGTSSRFVGERTEQNAMQNDDKAGGNLSANNSKTLVVYSSFIGEQYSVGVIEKGNTEIVADMIIEKLGADRYKVEPKVDNYPKDSYKKLTEIASEELHNNARPEIKDVTFDISNYDTILVGAPVWWGDFPMIMYTLFEKVDMNGKRIVPFSTHGGSGLSGFDTKLKRLYPNANVTKGLAITGADAQNKKENVKKEVDNFIESLKLD